MDDRFAPYLAAALASGDRDEVLFYGQYVEIKAAPTFAAFALASEADVTRLFRQRVAAIESPPAPHLLTLKSWNEGFTPATSRSEAERARDDALYLRLQSWRHERLSGSEWSACLDAIAHPTQWLALAQSHEAEGRVVLANAALAAARWADPEGAMDAIAAIVARRPAGLPPRLVAQPDPSFRALPFGERHWRAWGMKNTSLLDLPSLLAFESDENFSVRARVYRSLGQRPHPVSIPCLREATGDPHPFARAQAVRSLGWCVDPHAVHRLGVIASEDPHPDVRRTAEKARQRIIVWWRHFGDWERIVTDAVKVEAIVRGLLDEGLHGAAFEVLIRARASSPSLDALDESLEPDDSHLDAPERRYGFWFNDARREEGWIRESPDDIALAEALAGTDSEACERALLRVSFHRRTALRPQVEALRSSPGAIGWGARRAMRCMGWSARAPERATSG